MYNLAKAINDNTDAAGVGLAGKDFDNTMHQFMNYLYSNGGVVIDPVIPTALVVDRFGPLSGSD